MSNPSTTRCPRCGDPITAGAPAALCPRCLIAQALEDDGDTQSGLAEHASGRVLDILTVTCGAMPRVLLPDTAGADEPGPLIRPSSDEMPRPADRPVRLQLLGEIARGGMGAILKGRDLDLGRDLAVKVLLEKHEDRPEHVRRFVEEAQIGGQLQHPGIVPVYELGAFADRRPYFTMKLVKGRTLATLLAERPSPTEALPRFLSIFEAVCQTVAYAHARGVIHRDLKPSNVMVGSFGEVQVMDWGLAKVLQEGDGAEEPSPEPAAALSVIVTSRSGSASSGTEAGSVLGTPAYMSPEQASGEVVDERVDVFGLGSILCEILTAQPAYTARSQPELVRKATRGDTTDALSRLDTCCADAELVVRRESKYRYFYRSVRRDGHVVKQYFGREFDGELAAEFAAEKRERKQAESASLRAERARLEPLDRALKELERVTHLMLVEALWANGFHRKNYSRWRKKRARNTATRRTKTPSS